MEKKEPQSIEAEQSVLGAMILERNAVGKAIEMIDDSCFYLDSHKKIYRAILSLYDENEPVDLLTLSEALKKKNELDDVGGAAYLAELIDITAAPSHIGHYARIVLEKATLRKLIQTSGKIIEAGYEAAGDVDELLDKAEQLIFNIKEARVKSGFMPLKVLLKERFEVIEEIAANKRHITGVPSGWGDLDQVTSGFQPSEFIVIAGRPGTGKTSFCLNIAQYAAAREGMPVGVFSLEMSKEQLVQRMLCTEARVPLRNVRTGYIARDEWTKLTIAAGTLSEASIFIDDTPAIPILELRAKARRLKSQFGAKLILVDYLQLVQGPRSVENRQQEISAISRSLKSLAKELGIPIIAASQLSRAVEKRESRRPILSDLRESGAIEQDADVVIFIYRQEAGKKGAGTGNVAEIILGKQRNGPSGGSVKLTFLREYTRFEDYTASKSYITEE
ncbi:replicative DNA helicase [candidate division WOR-3 bacterium JGI_Cruoil_03_44_89]|uniref:Replicative DNA helicase n=1 Tax=candidate division WOR-3 bacterium JGI_Cruoil_03_44_89 TaxID=1973748 RepID=A0A235BZD9_UNCW3|nr:MAG: replicative DNA helicase [candidate division WOR-3 bacterium JGI_Cruoil_03_44_89]